MSTGSARRRPLAPSGPGRRALRGYTPGDVIRDAHLGGRDTGRRVVRDIASGTTFGDVYEVVVGGGGAATTATREALKMIALTDARTGAPLSDAERVRRLRPHAWRPTRCSRLAAATRTCVGPRRAFDGSTDFYVFLDLVPGCQSLSHTSS
mmetsp:Transcript_15011/g.60276  ORF Transcript_15011/g.60276 Transcript_15011/m.60276 type:complete len:151 (-) Transcript_15011:1593-2045(-)